jgi:hypothetical protein
MDMKSSTVACHTEKELVSTAGGFRSGAADSVKMNTMLKYQGPIYCHTFSSTDYLDCLTLEDERTAVF